MVLAYLCFTSIAFLVGAKSLIFPRFILDESLGYHVDRARGPLLQAVANGVSLNLLGVLALHALLRGRIRGLRAAVLLASLPVAILATMTRAVWVSFAVSVAVLIFRSHNRRLRRICVAVTIVGTLGLLIALSFDDQRRALTDRLQESGPLRFPSGSLRRRLADVSGKTVDRLGREPDAGGVGAARQRLQGKGAVSAQYLSGVAGGTRHLRFSALLRG